MREAIRDWNVSVALQQWREKALKPLAQKLGIPVPDADLKGVAAVDAEMTQWLAALQQEDTVRALLMAQWLAAVTALDTKRAANGFGVLSDQPGKTGLLLPKLVALRKAGRPVSDGSYRVEVQSEAGDRLALEVKYCFNSAILLFYANGTVQDFEQVAGDRALDVLFEFQFSRDKGFQFSAIFTRVNGGTASKQHFAADGWPGFKPTGITVSPLDFDLTRDPLRVLWAPITFDWDNWTNPERSVQDYWNGGKALTDSWE